MADRVLEWLYFCHHDWDLGRCRRCGVDRGIVGGEATPAPADAAELPSYATAPPPPPRLIGREPIAIDTGGFDPWADTPLGPSVIAAAPPPPPERVDESAEAELVALVNATRAAEGRPPLIEDPAIRAIARAHSADLRDRAFFSHLNPDGFGPADRAHRAGLAFTRFAENIALADAITDAHQSLLASPGHRANLLDPDFRRLGIGIVKHGRVRYSITQNFAD